MSTILTWIWLNFDPNTVWFIVSISFNFIWLGISSWYFLLKTVSILASFITKKRTLVKTLVYRIWVMLSSYIVIVLTGQTWAQALIPTIILNVLWSISYYSYDRLWQKTKWGIINDSKKRNRIRKI